MLLSDEACVEVIVFSSATQLSEGSFELFPLCGHYSVLLQYSQLQFSKAALLTVKRHLSFAFQVFWFFAYKIPNYCSLSFHKAGNFLLYKKIS